jgi:hypothetical protein
MFFKDGKTVILMENGHQHEENENKIQKFSKKFLLLELDHQNLGN